MHNVTSYSGAMQFAIDVFNYFNRKINYIIPAHCLLFGNSKMNGAYGDTTLDVVELNLPNIFSDITSNSMYKENEIRGLIVYTIIHELLHIDQNIAVYKNLTKNKQEFSKLIELSAHAMTFKIFNQIVDQVLFTDLNLSSIYIPSSLSFMSIKPEETEKIEIWKHSYYRVSNIIENAVYFLNYFSGINFIETVKKYSLSYLVLNISIDGILIKSDYVYYLDTWLAFSIFTLLRPIAIRSKASSHPLEVEVTDQYIYYTEEFSSYVGHIDINIHFVDKLKIVI